MEKNKLKIFSPVTLIIVISLLLNFILWINVSSYKAFINDEITRSLKIMESDLINTQELLSSVIGSEKIDELQHEKIYSDYDDFENEYKDLYHYYYKFKSENKDFTEINLLFEMNNFLYDFGKDNRLSSYNSKKDNLIIIPLSENEVESLKSFYDKNNEYLNVINKYKDRKYDVNKGNWTQIIDGIYEKGINK